MSRPSLQRQILAWTLGSLLLVWSVFIFIGYRTGVHESDELTDGHLASVASLLLAQPDLMFRERVDASTLGVPPSLKAHDYQQSMSVYIWDQSGAVIERTGPAPEPSYETEEGFATLTLGEPPQRWRVYSRWNNEGHSRKISVLLSMAESDALAADIATHVAAPGLWLIPIVAIVLTLAVRRGLRPLTELSASVRELDVNHVTKLQAPPHEEFQAMVGAIETLSSRYQAALRHERELADTFAHELRTPLSSLELHASSLRGELSPEKREAALSQLEHAAARTTAIVEDLLALARASRTQLADAAQSLDLSSLARDVAVEFAQAAYETGHELAVVGPDYLRAVGHPVLLEIALRNLISNAIGHTPVGTTIEVRLSDDPLSVNVCDDGYTKTSNSEQASTNRTVVGLGLGHQVVKRIATIHGGDFITQEPDSSGWRCYSIYLEPRDAQASNASTPQ